MNLETVRKEFRKKNPYGNIWILHPSGRLEESGKLTGKFSIHYKENSKGYIFTAKTVYSLAEKLNLIPELIYDAWIESEKVLNSLLSGIPEVLSYGGLSDTIRYLANKRGLTIKLSIKESKDEFDRTFNIYSIRKD